MSIHEVMRELKTYDDRIKRAQNQTFVTANKHSNEKIGSKTVAQVSETFKGNFQSVQALVENYSRLKAALALSNATTIVVIGGLEMTVTEAIERKSVTIPRKKTTLNILKSQFISEVARMSTENGKLPIGLESYLQAALGEKRTPEEVETHTKSYYTRNTYELIDPSNLEDRINELEEELLAFTAAIDVSLSESNALTKVKVDLVD